LTVLHTTEHKIGPFGDVFPASLLANSDRHKYAVWHSQPTHTHTHTQPFYGSVEFVRDNPGEPVPEETFTHYTHPLHSSWSSIIPICFLHLLRHMASSVFNPRALKSFSTISQPT